MTNQTPYQSQNQEVLIAKVRSLREQLLFLETQIERLPETGGNTMSSGGKAIMDAISMEALLKSALKYWWVVLVITILATGVGYYTESTKPDEYKSKVTVRIPPDHLGQTGSALTKDPNQLLNTYAEILKSGPMLDATIARLAEQGFDVGRRQIARDLDVVVIEGTELMSITVITGNPELTAAAANALAEVLLEYIRDQYVGGGTEDAVQILRTQLAQAEVALEEVQSTLQGLLTSADEMENAGVATDDATWIALQEEIIRTNSRVEFETARYTDLLNRYDDAVLVASARTNRVGVIQPAWVPTYPSSEISLRTVIMIAIMGLLGGMVLAHSLVIALSIVKTSRQARRARDADGPEDRLTPTNSEAVETP